MALHRYDSKERIGSTNDSLFLCEGDHLPIIAENINIWKQYGDYETAANYCRSKKSKKESKSIIDGDGSAEGTARIGTFIGSKTLVSH